MKSMRVAAAVIGGLIVLAPLCAVAGPQFLAYEGKDAIQQGRGGEKKTVDGVDFWMNGAPPRKFQVLGSLADRRHASGIYGAIRMSALDSDIAKATKQVGGDAVILQGEGNDVVGVASFGNTNVNSYGTANVTGGRGWANVNGQGHAWGTTSAFAAPIMKHDARFIVVRYLPDETAPAAAPPPAATASPTVPQAAPAAAPGATVPPQPKA